MALPLHGYSPIAVLVSRNLVRFDDTCLSYDTTFSKQRPVHHLFMQWPVTGNGRRAGQPLGGKRERYVRCTMHLQFGKIWKVLETSFRQEGKRVVCQVPFRIERTCRAEQRQTSQQEKKLTSVTTRICLDVMADVIRPFAPHCPGRQPS